MTGVDIPEDVLVAHLDGEAVLLHMETKRYYRLNETAQRIWQLLERGLERDAIVASLVAEFEVDAETAGAELDRLVQELRHHGLLGRPGAGGADGGGSGG
ncbi:MAG TPA: PqqD family protein [Longimicrobiales bacterium]